MFYVIISGHLFNDKNPERTEERVVHFVLHVSENYGAVDMLLLSLHKVLPFVTNIVNPCLLGNVYPKSWKISKIKLSAKKNNPAS